MAIQLDHVIVPSRHRVASAKLLADLLGVPWEKARGEFTPVYVNDSLTLDFADRDQFQRSHLCFRVSDGDFDAIFNSWRIGFAKPDRRIFEHVTAALDIDPTACVFIDDNVAKLEGAREIGMQVVHFTGYDALVEELRLFEVVA